MLTNYLRGRHKERLSDDWRRYERQRYANHSNNSILVDFYSATNLGDDLLLHALLKRYPNTQFIMLASREERILEMQYDN